MSYRVLPSFVNDPLNKYVFILETLRAIRDNFGAISLDWEGIEKDSHVNYIIEYTVR
jgi:hypothetical protein